MTDIVDAIAIGLVVILILGPSILIARTSGRSTRERTVWAILSLTPLPLAIGGWILALTLLKPPGGIHSNYGGVAALAAFVSPWLIYAVFRASNRGKRAH